MVNVVAIQMTSTPHVDQNLRFVESQLKSLPDPAKVTSLVVLPECFARFGSRDAEQLAIAESKGAGYMQDELSRMAKQYRCYLVAGTIPLKTDDENKFTASSLLYSPEGELMAEYQKIHLFDVAVNDNTGSYLESKYPRHGGRVVVVDTPIGRIGMAVCYDVRFSGLFTAMGDIDILVLPAAFTQRTGEAHWEVLLRSRAIEKQCFVVGAGQTGIHANNRETYGHSMIISPWGEIMAENAIDTGIVCAEIDINDRKKLKTNMPVSQHNRFRSQLV